MFKNEVKMIGSVVDIIYGNEQEAKFIISIPRLSENKDDIPVVVSDKLLIHEEIDKGTKIFITGMIRTKDYTENGNLKVSVFVYADDLKVLTDDEYNKSEKLNQVVLDGTISREVRFRHTRTGRFVTDIMLAFNHNLPRTKMSYYIPCIAWGANAKAAKKLKPGDNISVLGRFQSRKYHRKDDTNTYVAYEVSILDYSLKKKKAASNE